MNIQLLSELVAIPSFAPQEKNISKFLQQQLKELNFSIKTVAIGSNRKNLLATRGKAKTYPLFYGHMDTVQPVNKDQWKTDPFQVTTKGDYVYGLGTYDMKGGIAAFIEAIRNISTPVKILLSVDEEEISEGAWTVLEKNKEFFSDVDLIISAEPNFDLGLHGITTARTGRCIFQTIIIGKPAHIAKYKDGIDAVELASLYISELYNLRETWQKKYGTIIQVRSINGDSVGMSVCASVSLSIEAIIGTDDSIDQIQSRLSTIFRTTVSLKERKTPYLPSYSFDTFPHQKTIKAIIKQITGKNMKLHTRQSVGDDNVLATLGIPVITWGPDGGNAHAPNEYVSLSSLKTLSSMYKEVLMQAYP